jgi:hypothetical protein
MPALNLNWWSIALRGARPHRLDRHKITGIKIVLPALVLFWEALKDLSG